MKRWAAIGIGVLLLLWGPFLYWQLQHDESPSGPVAGPEPPALAPAMPAPAAEPSVPAAADPEPALPVAPPPSAQTAPAAAPEQQSAALDQVAPPSSGPLAELRAAYESSSRDEKAGIVEADVRSEFGKGEVPYDMLRTLSCHKAACKVELRWSPERAFLFMRLSMTWAARYTSQVAMEPGPKDEDGFVPVTIYFTRGREPTAEELAPQPEPERQPVK